MLFSLCLAGCSSPAHPLPALAAAPGATQPVRLWQDASIFQLVGGLIGSAHRRVMVEMYELGRPDIVRELGDAVGRGVVVRVITDPTVVPSRRSAATLDALGVAERAYPVDDGRHQIDHVKLLIVDGEVLDGKRVKYLTKDAMLAKDYQTQIMGLNNVIASYAGQVDELKHELAVTK